MKEKRKGNQMKKLVIILALLVVGCDGGRIFNPNEQIDENLMDGLSYDYVIENYIVSTSIFTIEGIIINTSDTLSIPRYPSDGKPFEGETDSNWYIKADIYSDDTYTLKLGEFWKIMETPLAPGDTTEFKIISVPANEHVNTNVYNGGKQAKDYPDFRVDWFRIYFY